jgi:hypothetical protein
MKPAAVLWIQFPAKTNGCYLYGSCVPALSVDANALLLHGAEHAAHAAIA